MAAMAAPDWRDLGFLTPDAPDLQREFWALQAELRGRLAEALDDLALRTAEPTWAAGLADAAAGARALADELRAEAGEAARERVRDDEAVRALCGALDEVLASGHVASVIAAGFVVLGELGTLPARLLEDVAGPWVRPLCARLVASEHHRPLGRLFGALDLPPREREALRRMLRHLNALLHDVHATWRQSFHALGVDGEVLDEGAAAALRAAGEMLGLRVTAADLAPFRS